MRMMNEKEEGFTLIELMVVIVIIGLLTTIVVINVMPAQDKAMAQKAKADVALLEQAVERYRLDNLTYPDQITALIDPPAGLARPERYARGGYVKRLPEDPWGQAYQYASPGRNGRPYAITSLGADGREGGSGKDADITSN